MATDSSVDLVRPPAWFGVGARSPLRRGRMLRRGSLPLRALRGTGNALHQRRHGLLTLIFACSLWCVPPPPVHAEAVAASPARAANPERSDPAFSVAIKQLNYESPLSTRPLPLMLWYPTDAQETSVVIRHLQLRAVPDGRPRDGLHPLVILSHGSGGSHLSHWRTAQFLAKHGYVVATPVHALDNAQDLQGSSTLKVWANRPREWDAALDAVLASELARSVDTRRVVAMGFSAGAYTALVAGGAQPSSLALDQYCLDHPHGDVMCLDHDVVAPGRIHGQRKLSHMQEQLRPVPAVRAAAVVAMAPVGDALFTAQGLKRLRLPTLLLQGSDDTVLTYPNDARYVHAQLKTRADYFTVPGGHEVFLSLGFEGSESEAHLAALARAHGLIQTFLSSIDWEAPR